MAPELQERHAEDLQRERDRLDVSHCTCESRAGEGKGTLRARRPRWPLLPVHQNGPFRRQGWRVQTRHVMLNGEQAEVRHGVHAGCGGTGSGSYPAWVAASALPRFEGYMLEVETFLKGSDFLRESRAEQAAARAGEWPDAMLWAEHQTDGILVVHAELQSLPSLSCEMAEVGDGWRVVMR